MERRFNSPPNSDTLITTEYDAEHGDVSRTQSIDLTTGAIVVTYDYRWTYDSQGRPVTRRIDSTGAITDTRVTRYRYGACGVEVETEEDGEGVIGQNLTTTYFRDGYRVVWGFGSAGTVVATTDGFVDPTTGAPVWDRTFQENGVRVDAYRTFDDLTGWLLTTRLVVDATPLQEVEEQRWSWTYDEVGRLLREDYEKDPGGERHLTYRWTCPAP